MAKVLLVYVNSFMDNLVPIGVSLLSACLKDAGHSVTLFDTTFYRTADKTGDEARVESLQVRAVNLADYGILEKGVQLEEGFRGAIKSSAPDFIAMSVVETTWFIAERLLAVCKEMKVISIVGGVHATMDAHSILEGGYSDYVCVGEGEGAIIEFANSIKIDKDCYGIHNIWTIRKGKVVKNPLRPLVDLNSLPDQDWSIYEKERFYKPMGGRAWVCGPIELDRGCAFKCTFCCNERLHEMYKQHGRYSRERSVSKFISELRDKISKYRLQYVYIVSENFLQMSDARLKEFLSLYSGIGLPFWIETRPETVTADKLKKLKAVGCEGISIGVEHGNDEFRRKYLNRFIKDDIIIKAFESARVAGIRSCSNNILGFPYETRELFFDTVRMNRKLRPDNPIINIFSPYKGTKLRDLCCTKGFIPSEKAAGDYRMDSSLLSGTLEGENVRGLQRVFPLYVAFPESRWDEIKKAESFDEAGDKVFSALREEYIALVIRK